MTNIKYRCPHTSKTFADRSERIAARMEQFDVSENAVWLPVLDVRIVNSIPVLHETGNHYTLVICPVCGSEKRIVTDQEVI